MSSSSSHPFKGRTVAIVNDLTPDEQWYLYMKTKELREAVAAGKDLTPFRLKSYEAAVYTIFMEDSTRTKESFRNAAEFHGLKVNVFDAQTSSFQKNETMTDTVKMLVGYSIGQTTFVIRSKIEGVCTWLDQAITTYCARQGLPRASFINAGDGRHEHPSQEMLDGYTFLEQQGFDRSSIHLALIGDLFHGRTVHSKVDGLKIYGKVEVDLIAPPDLALPPHYEERMVALGYSVRKFGSIAEYLAQSKVAKLWYFTRLQLERMGDKVKSMAPLLREAVTMQRDFIEKLPAGTKFFHPLPRDARHPTLPFWLDNTEFNGWDRQSQNGYFARIVLLGMVGGRFGDDFEALTGKPHCPRILTRARSETFDPEDAADYAVEVPVSDDGPSTDPAQALEKGVLIERLAEGRLDEQIFGLVRMVRSVVGLHGVGTQGIVRPAGSLPSGFICIPGLELSAWDNDMLKRLACIAAGGVVKDFMDGKVRKVIELSLPRKVAGFPNIKCKNEQCVSHPSSGQREVAACFLRVGREHVKQPDSAIVAPQAAKEYRLECRYCETPHDSVEIWDFQDYRMTMDMI
mmetsp:Transcript_402/g.904  ORF Transcript_402/g.904 Transcript_402/m.904 type:complete len:572 (-) Transcript_402:47-1762(-)